MTFSTSRPRPAAEPGAPGIDRPLAVVSAVASVGAIAVSSCCALPLAFAAVGIGAGWLGELAAFAAWRPWILGVAGLALAAGWIASARRRRSTACGVDGACATPSRRFLPGVALALATTALVVAAAWGSLEEPALAALARSM